MLLGKIDAVRATERVYGVRAVADDIEAKIPPSGQRSDSDIAEEIARERRWNTIISDAVEVEVRDGRVTLRGEVEWGYQRLNAERAVRHLAGVRSVASMETVKPRARPLARDIEQRVNDAIERLADLDARSIWGDHQQRRQGKTARLRPFSGGAQVRRTCRGSRTGRPDCGKRPGRHALKAVSRGRDGRVRRTDNQGGPHDPGRTQGSS